MVGGFMIKQWLMLAGLILGVIQAAVELIKSFEVPGFGTEKKNLVMQILEGVFNVLKAKLGDAIDVVWDDIQGLISTVVDTVVGFFNAIGVFKKGT